MRRVVPIIPVWKCLVLGAFVAFATFPVLASNTTDPVFAAKRAAEDLKSATRALSDARIAKDRVEALGRVIRAYENGLEAMRSSLRKAVIREHAIRLEFQARRDQLSRLLGVLQTLERASTPLLLIHPSGPLGTARSGQVLAEITPALHSQAEELRSQLEELQLLEALQITALDDLKSGLRGVQEARLELTESMGQRKNLPKRYISDKAALKQLVENAETMRGFAQGLTDLPFEDAEESSSDFSAEKGQLSLPVYGTLLRRYNEADAAGLRPPGIILSAPPVSLVTAPFPATIRFLGPLLDYGNVIILEPKAGYLIVLAGLGQVYGEVGQILAKGDPVGLMSGKDPAAEDFLLDASQGTGEIRQQTLYIEIRQDRDTVDPSAWFALNEEQSDR